MKNRIFGLSLFFSWFQEKRRNNIPSAAAIDPKPSHCQRRDDMSTAALMLKVNNAKDPPLSRQVFCSFPLFFDAGLMDAGRETTLSAGHSAFLIPHSAFRIQDYIIPSIPPPMGIGGVGGVGSLWLLMTHSVVSSMPAIEAAFSNATLDTLTGSMTPVLSKFS